MSEVLRPSCAYADSHSSCAGFSNHLHISSAQSDDLDCDSGSNSGRYIPSYVNFADHLIPGAAEGQSEFNVKIELVVRDIRRPIGVAVMPSGEFAIASSEDEEVRMYSPNGKAYPLEVKANMPLTFRRLQAN